MPSSFFPFSFQTQIAVCSWCPEVRDKILVQCNCFPHHGAYLSPQPVCDLDEVWGEIKGRAEVKTQVPRLLSTPCLATEVQALSSIRAS